MQDIDFDIIVRGINLRPEQGGLGFSTCVLLHDGAEHILYDTGSYGVRDIIKNLINKNKVTKLVVSHLHFDHCANIDLFKHIPVFISPIEIFNLEHNQDINTYEAFSYFKDMLNIFPLKNLQKITPNITAIHTPGHTLGHFSLSFLANSKKYLAAGDAIKSVNEFSSNAYIVPPIDELKQKKTTEYIKNNYDYIIPGHQDIFNVKTLIEPIIQLSKF